MSGQARLLFDLAVYAAFVYAGWEIGRRKNRGRWWGLLGLLGLIIVALLGRGDDGTPTAAVQGAAAPPNAPAAGWYGDPGDDAQLRYWNGIAWTEQVGPASVARGSAQPG